MKSILILGALLLSSPALAQYNPYPYSGGAPITYPSLPQAPPPPAFVQAPPFPVIPAPTAPPPIIPANYGYGNPYSYRR